MPHVPPHHLLLPAPCLPLRERWHASCSPALWTGGRLRRTRRRRDQAFALLLPLSLPAYLSPTAGRGCCTPAATAMLLLSALGRDTLHHLGTKHASKPPLPPGGCSTSGSTHLTWEDGSTANSPTSLWMSSYSMCQLASASQSDIMGRALGRPVSWA